MIFAPDFEAQRKRMVARQLAGRGIDDPRVIDAMGAAPRELFTPPELRGAAYDDRALPIGEGQTISQPYVVALMIQALALRGGERVLEIGAGCGYAAAVLSHLAAAVFAIERIPTLAERALEALAAAGVENAHVRCGDGSLGWPERAPFDAILVSAAAPRAPTALLEQLAPGGRLVAPIGEPFQQSVTRLTRGEDGAAREERLADVRFVPLIGEQGWR